MIEWVVVSYRNSTSNHNALAVAWSSAVLYLIEILHQTTTLRRHERSPPGCILSKFYIKPQQLNWEKEVPVVVSYRNSTSNHNEAGMTRNQRSVVSYRNSTSNHNPLNMRFSRSLLYLIEILHQTTTCTEKVSLPDWLYLIEILHQTTTLTKSNMA